MINIFLSSLLLKNRNNCDNYYLPENDFKKIYDELCQYLDGNIN